MSRQWLEYVTGVQLGFRVYAIYPEPIYMMVAGQTPSIGKNSKKTADRIPALFS
jgi:hypothetical protein